MQDLIKPGAVVEHLSGSPRLTVQSVFETTKGDYSAIVSWFMGDQRREATVPLVTLKLIEPAPQSIATADLSEAVRLMVMDIASRWSHGPEFFMGNYLKLLGQVATVFSKPSETVSPGQADSLTRSLIQLHEKVDQIRDLVTPRPVELNFEFSGKSQQDAEVIRKENPV